MRHVTTVPSAVKLGSCSACMGGAWRAYTRGHATGRTSEKRTKKQPQLTRDDIPVVTHNVSGLSHCQLQFSTVLPRANAHKKDRQCNGGVGRHGTSSGQWVCPGPRCGCNARPLWMWRRVVYHWAGAAWRSASALLFSAIVGDTITTMAGPIMCVFRGSTSERHGESVPDLSSKQLAVTSPHSLRWQPRLLELKACRYCLVLFPRRAAKPVSFPTSKSAGQATLAHAPTPSVVPPICDVLAVFFPSAPLLYPPASRSVKREDAHMPRARTSAGPSCAGMSLSSRGERGQCAVAAGGGVS